MNLLSVSHLLRLPRSLTALTDSAAALALTGGAAQTLEGAGNTLTVTAALLLFYAGASALEDVLEPADTLGEVESPASGAQGVGRGLAGLISAVLLLVGLSLCAVVGPNALVVGVLLLIVVVGYQGALAGRPVVGPLGRALRRILGWSLALTAAGHFPPAAPAALVLVGLYEFSAAHAAPGAGREARRGGLMVLLLGWVAAALGGIALAAAHEGLEVRSLRSAALAVAVVGWAAFVLPPLTRALTRAETYSVRTAAKSAVESISFFGLLLAVGISAWWTALFCASIVVAQELLRRRLAPPGIVA